MRDTQNLVRAGQQPQAATDGLRAASADSGVDFVEDEGGGAIRAGENLLDGQRHSGEFPARRDAGQRSRRLAGVRSDHEYDRVEARPVEPQPRAIDLHGRLVGPGRASRDLDSERRVAEAQAG